MLAVIIVINVTGCFITGMLGIGTARQSALFRKTVKVIMICWVVFLTALAYNTPHPELGSSLSSAIALFAGIITTQISYAIGCRIGRRLFPR